MGLLKKRLVLKLMLPSLLWSLLRYLILDDREYCTYWYSESNFKNTQDGGEKPTL